MTDSYKFMIHYLQPLPNRVTNIDSSEYGVQWVASKLEGMAISVWQDWSFHDRKIHRSIEHYPTPSPMTSITRLTSARRLPGLPLQGTYLHAALISSMSRNYWKRLRVFKISKLWQEARREFPTKPYRRLTFDTRTATDSLLMWKDM
jgi:hypothetical protein